MIGWEILSNVKEGAGLMMIAAAQPQTAEGLPIILWVVIGIVVGLVLIVGATYFLSHMLNDRFIRSQQLDAENIIILSKDKAQQIESEAKDNAIQVLKDAENEIKKRRNELTREDDRLQKRRNELDNRIEKLEQRESNLNKREQLGQTLQRNRQDGDQTA